MSVFAGRHTADLEGDFVVFLIGMRFNRPWKVRRTWTVFSAMRPMVKELEAQPDSGLLRAEFALIYGGPAVVQFWRSFDALERYARDPDARHLPAWRRFNQLVRGSGDVGIWHETYRVGAGRYEAIYGNMPRVGLGAAGEHRPLGSTSTAARRIGARPEDQAPVAGY
jgi:Domain of unknown function (DUF4188)